MKNTKDTMRKLVPSMTRKLFWTVALAFLGTLAAFAELTVTGYVRDAGTGAPIVAAEIQVQNRKISTVTDEQGHYTIKVVEGTDVLQVKAYDYNPLEVPVKGRTSVLINMNSDVFTPVFKNVETLNMKAAQSELTASLKAMSPDGIRPVLTVDDLIASGMSGTVRGISRSGVSNQGSSLFLGGISSLNANAQPLFVVDGVIWENLYDMSSIHLGFFSNTLENLDINDIESISVIKDGTSIYGSKAANGVVLIKTKRSNSQVTKIDVNIKKGLTDAPGTVPMMNGEQYRLYSSEMFGTIDFPNGVISEKGYLSAGYSTTGAPLSAVTDLGYLETNKNARIYNKYHNNTDWNKEVYRQGDNQSYEMNVMGGDENAAYYFSLGYTGGKGIIKKTDMSRINTRFNADLKLLPRLSMDFNVNFARTEHSMQDDAADFFLSPTWMSKIKSPFVSPYAYTLMGERNYDYSDADIFGVGNPDAIMKSSLNNNRTFRFNLAVRPEFTINRELKVSTLFDYNLLKGNERKFLPMNGSAMRFIDGWGYSTNEVNAQVFRNEGFFSDTRLIWEKKLDDSQNLRTIYGLRFNYNKLSSTYAEEHNTGSDIYKYITGGYSYLQVHGLNNKTKSLSNYIQSEYSYEKRYILNASVAFDGSSRFGDETKSGLNIFGHSFGVFPSVSGAWVASSEEFMKDINLIDYWKIRGGYTVTGNDGIKDYASMAYFQSTNYMKMANGLVISNLYNPKLQWETTGKLYLGTDLTMDDNRLTFSGDIYSSRTNNLLTLKDASEVSGLGKYWSNGGTMTNKGFELSASYKALNMKNLKWEVGGNVGHYKNKITALPNGSYTTSVYEGEVITAVGKEAGSFWGYRSLGVISSADDASKAYHNAQNDTYSYMRMRNADGSYSKFNAGDILFKDKDNNGVIDERDKEVIGSANPDFFGGFYSNLTVDKFTLSAMFNFSVGNDVYNYSRRLLESGQDMSNQTVAMLNRWTGDGQKTNQPRAAWGDPMGNARFSDRWIEDGSYLRLKTLTLSYILPVKTSFLEGAKIWVSADNLLTWSKYLGLDPEFSAGNSVYMQGIDAGSTPLTRTYTLGLKLNL